MRALFPIGLLALACQNPASTSTEFCNIPWDDNFEAGCEQVDLCVPSQIATCTGNYCCHEFCSVQGCGIGGAQVLISPDQVPDGGLSDHLCTVADGGSQCLCSADGGQCFWSNYLCVCGDPSSS